MLPYTYGVYSDFVTSSVKSEIKPLNTEEFVLCVFITVKWENCNCCSTSRFASVFDLILPIWISVDGGKNTKNLFVLLLLWGEINNQHLVGISGFVFHDLGVQECSICCSCMGSTFPLLGMLFLLERSSGSLAAPPKSSPKFCVVGSTKLPSLGCNLH